MKTPMFHPAPAQRPRPRHVWHCPVCSRQVESPTVPHGWAVVDQIGVVMCGTCLDRARRRLALLTAMDLEEVEA